MTAILTVQLVTYALLGGWFLSHGNWRLGVAQLLLLGVQGLVFG